MTRRKQASAGKSHSQRNSRISQCSRDEVPAKLCNILRDGVAPLASKTLVGRETAAEAQTPARAERNGGNTGPGTGSTMIPDGRFEFGTTEGIGVILHSRVDRCRRSQLQEIELVRTAGKLGNSQSIWDKKARVTRGDG